MAERGGPRTLVKGVGFREQMPPTPVAPSVPSMPARSVPTGPLEAQVGARQGSGTYRPSVDPRTFGWGAGPEERVHPSPMPPSEPARPDRGPPPGPPRG